MPAPIDDWVPSRNPHFTSAAQTRHRSGRGGRRPGTGLAHQARPPWRRLKRASKRASVGASPRIYERRSAHRRRICTGENSKNDSIKGEGPPASRSADAGAGPTLTAVRNAAWQQTGPMNPRRPWRPLAPWRWKDLSRATAARPASPTPPHDTGRQPASSGISRRRARPGRPRRPATPPA
jgi:hypothetical protein